MCAVCKKTSWKMLDTKLHINTQSLRKEDGKMVEERRQGNMSGSQGEGRKRWNPRERERKRKERSTSLRTHRTSRRIVDKRILGTGISAIVRAGEQQMTGTQQGRVLKHQQQLKNFNTRPSVKCDFRILGFASRIEAFQLDRMDPSLRTITFGADTTACKTVRAFPTEDSWGPCGAQGT